MRLPPKAPGPATGGGRFKARVCARCGKPRGTTSFRYDANGVWQRDHFHPKCFESMLGSLSKADTGSGHEEGSALLTREGVLPVSGSSQTCSKE